MSSHCQLMPGIGLTTRKPIQVMRDSPAVMQGQFPWRDRIHILLQGKTTYNIIFFQGTGKSCLILTKPSDFQEARGYRLKFMLSRNSFSAPRHTLVHSIQKRIPRTQLLSALHLNSVHVQAQSSQCFTKGSGGYIESTPHYQKSLCLYSFCESHK